MKEVRKKKYKIKTGNILIAAFILILIIALLYRPVKSMITLLNKNYDFDVSLKIYQKGLTKNVLEKDYSKTFSSAIKNNNYNEEYFEFYFKTNYYEYENFIQTINQLFKTGYTPETINIINSKNDLKLVDILKDKYVSDIDKFLEYDFFKISNLDRYLNYYNGDYKDTIIKVNIGLDKDYYEDVNTIKDYSYDVIVNKYNMLDEKFIPDNLTELDNCSGKGEYLALDAKKYYDLLCDASKKAGLNLSVTSSYRDYANQKSTYDYYLKEYGENYAKKYVALPGYSEHQTGLALDVKSLNSNIFINSKEYKWMVENSYKYGFILRYPKGKENITGYNSEAWHFRFVGLDEAKYIYENNITYEEYRAMLKN